MQPWWKKRILKLAKESHCFQNCTYADIKYKKKVDRKKIEVIIQLCTSLRQIP